MAVHKGIESKASHVIRGYNTAPVITGMMWMERPWACSGCFNTANKFQCLCGRLFICGNTHEGYFQKSNCSQVCERSMYVWYLQLWQVSVKKRHKEASRIRFNCCLHRQGFRSAIRNQISICQPLIILIIIIGQGDWWNKIKNSLIQAFLMWIFSGLFAPLWQ